MSANLSSANETTSYDPKTIECPWHYDAKLREQSPVYHDTANDMYVVSSYELVSEVLHHPELYSSRYLPKMLSKEPFPDDIMAIYAKGFEMREALLVTDGEVHNRHRHIATKAFSCKRLDALALPLNRRASELLAKAIPKRIVESRA